MYYEAGNWLESMGTVLVPGYGGGYGDSRGDRVPTMVVFMITLFSWRVSLGVSAFFLWKNSGSVRPSETPSVIKLILRHTERRTIGRSVRLRQDRSLHPSVGPLVRLSTQTLAQSVALRHCRSLSFNEIGFTSRRLYVSV